MPLTVQSQGKPVLRRARGRPKKDTAQQELQQLEDVQNVGEPDTPHAMEEATPLPRNAPRMKENKEA